MIIHVSHKFILPVLIIICVCCKCLMACLSERSIIGSKPVAKCKQNQLHLTNGKVELLTLVFFTFDSFRKSSLLPEISA